MKRFSFKYLHILAPKLTLAQIVSPDGGPVATFGGGTLTVSEVDPGPEIIDTWEPPVMEGDRSVIWIHGLGGHGDLSASDESNSWIQASSTSDITTRWNHAGPTILMSWTLQALPCEPSWKTTTYLQMLS